MSLITSQYSFVCLLMVVCITITYGILRSTVLFSYQNNSKSVSRVELKPRPMQRSEKHERKKNETNRCESCNGKVPNYIIQYGRRRTATSLQFQILCLSMILLHEDEKNSVGCYFDNVTAEYKYTVLKTHYIEQYFKTIPSNSWIFLTSNSESAGGKGNLGWIKRKIRNRNLTIPYIADLQLVSKLGHFNIFEYQNIFGLSDKQMKHIAEYIRFWDILRRCCGVQMSADWRNHLSPRANYKRHYNPNNPAYPACEMYNISKVEQLLLNTYIFKKFSHVHSLRDAIGKPSLVDGTLDGTYCERCNANISKRNLKFNQNCE